MNGLQNLAPVRFGGALAAAAAALYAVCARAVALWPDATLDFFNAWFHGIEFGPLKAGRKPLTAGIFVYGLAGVAITAFVGGVLFAAFCNLFGRGALVDEGERRTGWSRFSDRSKTPLAACDICVREMEKGDWRRA